MEAVFAALSKRQSMLLLTSVTFGGQAALESFEHLPPEESALLKHRAVQLLAIPRDRRIPLLVQEMKRLVTVRRGRLWSTDPERLAEVLADERPALVEVVLRALPAGLAEATRDHLPPARLGARIEKEVRPEILNLIRWKLEERVAQKSVKGSFKFSDVALLRTRELLTLCDRLGGSAAAPALAALPELERMAFLDALTPDQKVFTESVLSNELLKPLTEEAARAYLAPYDQGRGPADLLRNLGTQRLARALVAQSPEFSQRVLERQSGDFGAALARWLREERPRVTGKIDAGRADIVLDLERLAKLGVVDYPTRLPPKKRGDAMRGTGTRERQRSVASGPHSAPGLSHGGGSLGPPRFRSASASASVSSPEFSAPGRRDIMAERAARKAGIPVGPPASYSSPERSLGRDRSMPGEMDPYRPAPGDDRTGTQSGSHSSDARSSQLLPSSSSGRASPSRHVSGAPAAAPGVLERRPRRRSVLDELAASEDVTDPARPIGLGALQIPDTTGDE